MQYKTTNRLFNGTYQYKVVLICAAASIFRSKDLSVVLKNLQKITIDPARKESYTNWKGTFVRTQHDVDYALNLYTTLSTLKDINVRVENPWVSIYTNSKSDVDILINIDPENVKYVCAPPENFELEKNTIIMSKIDFEYRVTLGKTTQDHSTFVQWAEGNSKLKLTKNCKKELSKNKSWGGTFFYVTGSNNLLLAKMHLGSSINRVERIIKA